MWQDYVFTIGIIIFAIALIPAIFSDQKPPLATSIPTAFFQFVFMATYITLGLWFSSGASLFCGSLWAVLAIQRYRQSLSKTRT